MSLSLLKYNADILVEVVENYEALLEKNIDKEKIAALKSQILVLLTSVKKAVEAEKNG